MKEAVRAAGLGVMSPGQYERELAEFIGETGASMTEMAGISAELLGEL
jgi:hypothetical protein